MLLTECTLTTLYAFAASYKTSLLSLMLQGRASIATLTTTSDKKCRP